MNRNRCNVPFQMNLLGKIDVMAYVILVAIVREIKKGD
jgi:hypothetical protein